MSRSSHLVSAHSIIALLAVMFMSGLLLASCGPIGVGIFATKPYPVQLTIGLGVSSMVASVGFSATLCCSRSVDPNQEYVFSQNWTKLASYKYNDRRLHLAGQRFQAITQVAWGTGSRTSKPVQAQWAVPVYNQGGASGPSYIYTSYPTVALYYTSG
jgi:hypothetical protein